MYSGGIGTANLPKLAAKYSNHHPHKHQLASPIDFAKQWFLNILQTLKSS